MKKCLATLLFGALFASLGANLYRDHLDREKQIEMHAKYVMVPRAFADIAEDGTQVISVRWDEKSNSWTEHNVPLATAKTEDDNLHSYANGRPLQYHDKIWWQP